MYQFTSCFSIVYVIINVATWWMNEKKRRAVKNVGVNSNNKRNYFGGNQVIMALLATLLTILFWLILEMEENHGKNKNKTSARLCKILS